MYLILCHFVLVYSFILLLTGVQGW
jgi:hypothetical protein